MVTPKVSVVMPVYNAEKYLREAIDSILRQTFDDFEFIIVNDCSKDTSWDIMQEYARRDPRVILIYNAQNLGEAGARNVGMAQARGQYIAAMDADDVSMADRLALQVKYLDENPEVGLLAGNAKRINARGQFLSMWQVPSDHATMRANLLFNNILAQATIMMRRSAYQQVGQYSSSLANDYELWWRFSRQSKLAALPQTLALIRVSQHADRLSFGQAPKQVLDSQEMSLRIARELMGDKLLHEEAYKRFFMASRGKDDSLIRFDVRRLQPLWDFVAADPVYRSVVTPKLVSIMMKLTYTQPVEAVSLLILLRTQFGVRWRHITKRYMVNYRRTPIRLLQRRVPTKRSTQPLGV